MKTLASFSKKIIKPVLIASVITGGLLATSLANAYAQFNMQICYYSLYTPSTSGDVKLTVKNNGGTFSKSNTFKWCGRYAQNFQVSDGNAGDYVNWPVGGAENMTVTIQSPTFKVTTAGVGAGSKDVTLSGSCTVQVPMMFVVAGYFKVDSSGKHPIFNPGAGGTQTYINGNIVKVKVSYPGSFANPVCTIDTSGL